MGRVRPAFFRTKVFKALQTETNFNVKIEGVVDVLLDATRKYDKPLSRERLLGWHNSLFQSGYSGYTKIQSKSLFYLRKPQPTLLPLEERLKFEVNENPTLAVSTQCAGITKNP